MEDKKWLVKAGGRILGPFSATEIENKLKQRELLALDEVAPRQGRWLYFRDSEVFDKTVRELRNKSVSSEENTHTNTQTATETMTDEVGGFRSHDKLKVGIEDQLRRPSVESNASQKNLPTVTPGGYYEVTSKRSSSKSGDVTRWAWAFVVVLIVGLSWSVLKDKTPQSNGIAETGEVKPLLKAGLEAKENGNYQAAIMFLQKAHRLDKNNLEVVLNLAPLLVFDRETVLARRILEPHMKESNGPSFLKKAHNVLALASLPTVDIAKAESHLDESLNSDSGYAPALVNRGIVHTMRKEYRKSSQRFDKANSLNVDKGVLALSALENSVEYYFATEDKSELQKSRDELSKYVREHYPFKQQALVGLGVAHTLLGEKEMAEKTLIQILDTDPDLTQNHTHDPMYYRERLTWGHVYAWFEKAYSKLEVSPELLAVNGYLTYRAKQSASAKKVIEDALLQDPSNDEIRSYLAYVQNRLGSSEDAEANARKAALKGESEISLLLKARICEARKNYLCASDAWDTLYRMNEKSIQSIRGKAEAALRNKDIDTAKDLLEKGLKLSPTYIPLLALKSELAENPK